MFRSTLSTGEILAKYFIHIYNIVGAVNVCDVEAYVIYILHYTYVCVGLLFSIMCGIFPYLNVPIHDL